MYPGLLRILILGIGVYFCGKGLTMTVMFASMALFPPSLEGAQSFQPFYTSMLCGSGLAPLLIGGLLLAFAPRLERLLLRSSVGISEASPPHVFPPDAFLPPVLRVLGLYLAATHLSEFVGASVELIHPTAAHGGAQAARNLGGLASNLAGLVIAGLLCFRTRVFVRLVSAR